MWVSGTLEYSAAPGMSEVIFSEDYIDISFTKQTYVDKIR